jgi:PQ loop repeat
MALSQLLGFLGTGIFAAAYIPQIHHLVKEHCSLESA